MVCRSKITLCFALIFSFALLMATAVSADPIENTPICHNPGPNQVTIIVDNSAVYDMHLNNHGDTLGVCEGSSSTCDVNQTLYACTGTPNACTTYGASDTCAAAGCSWTSTPLTTTQFSDPLNDIDNYWDNNNNDPYSDESSDSNCIPVTGSGTGSCLRIDDGGSNGNSEYLVKNDPVDLSACEDGTGLFAIAKVDEESGNNLESDDCVYARFSNDDGTTWAASRITIFCNDDPAPSFSTPIPDAYLTSQFLVRFEKAGFGDSSETAFLDNISISCGVPVSSCTGSPSTCESYTNDDTCFDAGCDVSCRDTTFCGDGITQNPNDEQVVETCDDGAQNGVACDPAYNSTCQYCSSSCAIVELTGEYCGDNVVNGAETCEAGDQIADPEHYTCNAQTCTLDYVPYCGDNNVDQGEQCDAGNQTGNYCTPGYGESCTFCGINCINDTMTGPYCGDGIMNGAEECDGQDGVGAHESCGETCLIVPLPYCGDLVKNGQEQCDGTDGVGAHQECNTDCNLVDLPYCGDDILNGDEQCDDGNNVDNDGCSATCTLEQLQSCEEQGGVQTCVGEANACDSYVDSQSCTFAGCDWSASQGQNDVTQWSESFASPASDWSPYASIGNGISHITNDHLNCINDANDDCIKFNGDGTPAASNISKQSNVDLSACSDGSATISIGKIKEYGTLESDDCAYFWFSADGGATWGSKTTIFCDDNPASTFSASIPDTYLTNQMRIRMERRNFGGEDERAYFDGLSVTCDIAGESVCQGSPDACSTYNDNEQACLAAGCDTTCEIPQVYCGDGIVNQQNETCDDGVNNGVTCEPGYDDVCDYCTSDCTVERLSGPYCGDQIKNGQEQCDGSDGVGAHQECNTDCNLVNLPYCGDGIVNQEGEQCDTTAPEGYECDAQCQLDELTCEEIPAAVLVSDTHTGLQAGGNALLVAQPYHPAWTANVPGALWIWDGSGVGIVNFTDSLAIAGAVSGDATLRVASDNSYRVWINGVLVGEDPEEWNYAAGHEEDYDITPYLIVGENEFVFEVNNWHGPAGLMYRVSYGNICEPEAYCGDGVVNQESEECDLQAGVPEGYTCFQDCSLHLTCEEAKSQGLLYGEIDSEGHAVVTNDADEDFLVTLASYEMYAPLIEDQELYSSDSQIVEGESSAEFSVTVPVCAYQIDLICGEPLPNNPVYTEEEKLDFDFSEGLEYCVPDEDEDATLVVLEGFPQCGNYVFQCSAYGFEATNYYWYFGDGQIQPNSTNSDVYHTYEDDGSYTVTCTATNGEQSASASIEIEAVTCPTCEEAIAMGLLTGEIDSEGHAIVHNDANINYTVSLASYEMYALLIEDQVLFDSDSADVAAFGGETELSVEVPACTYQIDLVCGSPLPFAPLYGDRVIDFDFANQEAAFCVPTGHEDEVTVDLSIGDGFPQGADYVFACDAQGFVPTGYYWYFGDGQIQPNSPNDNMWHTYTANGDYIVACTATNGTTWQTDTLLVSVEGIVDPSVTVSVDPEYPQGPAYVFLCEADGFTPLGYDWDFGDGEYLYDQLTADVYHEFSANGEYTVTCTASDGETTESGNVQVVVETCGEYELLITQVDPNPAAPEAPFTVSGTLTVGGLPVETETVAISFDEASQDASVLMGAWLGGFNAPTTPGEYLVSASFNGTCGEPVTASTTLFVEVPQQEGGDGEDELFQTESVEQPLASSPESNSHGGCAWGYHESDGMCVKDAPAVNTLAFDGGDVAGGNGDGEFLPEESLTEDGLPTEGDDTSGDLLTGAVIGGGLLSWSWLLVLIAIVAILGGAYWWQQR